MSKTYFFSRGLGLAILSLALLVVAGCQADNEAAVAETSKADAAKAPPLPDAKTPPATYKTQADYGKQQQQSNPFTKTGGYPGAK